MTADTLQPVLAQDEDLRIAAERRLMRIVIVGHVDHGKSTLVGRLLNDSGSLPEGRVDAIRAMSERRGMPFEWSFVMDALKAERDQGITIDSAQIWFKSALRDYVIIDAPGHKEFLKNMITGAAAAEAAVLVIDAAEGVREQSRRHGYLLHLLGLRQIAVVVNKMDLVGYDQARYDAVVAEYTDYLAGIGVTATHFVPVAAREGGNIVDRATGTMPWYGGPTVLEALDGFVPSPALDDRPLRLPVQDVYKFDERRIIVGRIESGRLAVGDTIMVSPANKTVRVRTIEHWGKGVPPVAAGTGRSVGITFDEQIFIERGDVISHAENPPVETDVFRARLFWLGRTPLTVGAGYLMKLATRQVRVTVDRIEKVIDAGSLAGADQGDRHQAVERNAVAEVVLRSRGLLALDEFRDLPNTGRFVLIEDYDTVGGGIISMDGYPDQRSAVTRKSTNITAVEHRVTAEARARRNGHTGGVLWLTGLSGAGKSTLAIELEQRLFAKGYQVFVLDGDNVRHGLNANLGFSPEDRTENIRRVGEVAALFAEAGFLVLTAFISPYRADRERARAAAGAGFHEVHVRADLDVCEGRDPKGLYAKARRGEIRDFTGIDAPYEPPAAPELVVDTGRLSIEEAVQSVMDYIERRFTITR